MNGFSAATLLMLTVVAPLVGAAVAWAMASRGPQAVRQSALVTALVTLGMVAILVLRGLSDPSLRSGSAFAVSTVPWFTDGSFDVRLSLGLDGLSLWMFALSALLTVTAVLVSWNSVRENVAGFYALLLLLEAAMLGVFAARDVILFYVCFEFTLVPLFFLIGIWGHEERRRAAVTFFLYTLAGSVLSFVGLLTIVVWNAAHSGRFSFDIAALTAGVRAHPLPMDGAGGWLQWLVFLALLAGFAIKVPIVPFHTWLPLAHVEAPTGGSVDLAGVLLKLGIYGFLRFSLPMLPEASAVAAPWLFALGAAGIVYGALVALVQTDLKRLVAYSSVSHMGYIVMGLFALEPAAVEGANLQLVNHGLSAAGLFALVGMIYERFHTRSIPDLGGLAARAPWLTTMFVLFTFASIGLPGLNGFAGEFLILAGSFQRAWQGVNAEWRPLYLACSAGAVAGLVLGAWYMLWAVERVFFGAERRAAEAHGHGPDHTPRHAAHAGVFDAPAADLEWHEWGAIAPLAVFALWIGLFPGAFLGPAAAAVRGVSAAAEQRFAERMQGGPALAPPSAGSQASAEPLATSVSRTSPPAHTERP